MGLIRDIRRYGLPFFTARGYAVIFAASFAVGVGIWFYTLSIRGMW